MRKMKNFRVWSAIVLIFLSGAVIGVIGSSLVIRKHVIGFMEGGPPRAIRRVIREVTKNLDLSAEQMAQIDSIMDENHSKIVRITGDFRDTMDEFFEEQSSQINQILTDEQQKEFEKRSLEIKKSLEKRIHRHHPGGRLRRRRPADRRARARRFALRAAEPPLVACAAR